MGHGAEGTLEEMAEGGEKPLKPEIPKVEEPKVEEKKEEPKPADKPAEKESESNG